MSVLLVVTPAGPDSEILAANLSARDFEVILAPNGALAVDLARRHRPDAILMDPNLSSMDRWHAVKRLHNDGATHAIPVLTLASDAQSPGGLQRILAKLERTIGPERVGTEPGAPSRARTSQPRRFEPESLDLLGLDIRPSDAEPPVRSATPEPQAERAAQQPAPAAPQRETPAPKSRKAPGGLRGRILVVDDNALNCDMLSRRLGRRGHAVDVAGDGQRALELVQSTRYDLVLLDWMMPGLSGIDVLQRIREWFGPAELPVIMATAKTETDDIVEALAHQANDYVTKPLNFDVVQARVLTQLRLVEAHRLLRMSERRYRALLENTGDMILQHRLDGTLTYVSPACRTLLGFEPETLKERSLYDWIHPIDRRALERGRAAGALPPAFTYIARLQRQDDSYLWVELSCRVVRGDEDGPADPTAEPLVLAACRDVTEHMVRVTSDEPPLPLGGDIMAHPGWRGGPTPPAPPAEAAGKAKLVFMTVVDGVESTLIGDGDALRQEVARHLSTLLDD